jgi:hypothetical protein
MTRINPVLVQAVERLFGEARMGLQFLELPHDEVNAPLLVGEDRARQLRSVLEGYVVGMANELDELGEEERPRLVAEARATLVALRELNRFFPK